MSLSEIVHNMMSRQRARFESERIDEQENEASPRVAEVGLNNEQSVSSAGEEHDVESGEEPRGNTDSRRTEDGAVQEGNGDSEDLESQGGEDNSQTMGDDQHDPPFGSSTRGHSPRSMTLADLEEQRELSRRRSSACVLLAVFVLFRLWIECLQKRDPMLLLLCLLGTSWTARWIRQNREREEELDRRIEAFLQNSNNGNEGNEEVMDRNEYARLSFQAQLALAIMESQRHMMEGGFGRPDGEEEQTPGVSQEAKARWKQFKWNGCMAKGCKKGDYGAVPTKVGDEAALDIDPQCSICLSEYEDSDLLTQLPCSHVYHTDCINSWTENHQKCPLCNMDLETGASAGETVV